VPPELQRQVHATVVQAKERSGWPARRTLAALGIARSTYQRWLREEAWAKTLPEEPVKPVQPYEASVEEKQAVLDYARKHVELRHRELAWRMVDEDVVFLSPSTVYRILKTASLVCPWRRRMKRRREEAEKATRPNERWSTDVMQIQVGEGTYFVVSSLMCPCPQETLPAVYSTLHPAETSYANAEWRCAHCGRYRRPLGNSWAQKRIS
jgi:hypothetical protein